MFQETSTFDVYITTRYSLFSVTFCLQRQKVTKERRRRRIFAKNLLTPLNSRGWRFPQPHAAKPRVLNFAIKRNGTSFCKIIVDYSTIL